MLKFLFDYYDKKNINIFVLTAKFAHGRGTQRA